jgi:hypothetical protein
MQSAKWFWQVRTLTPLARSFSDQTRAWSRSDAASFA